jgi:hypothetical protein
MSVTFERSPPFELAVRLVSFERCRVEVSSVDADLKAASESWWDGAEARALAGVLAESLAVFPELRVLCDRSRRLCHFSVRQVSRSTVVMCLICSGPNQ